MIVGEAVEGDFSGIGIADVEGGSGEVLGGPQVAVAVPAVDGERGAGFEGEAAEVEGVVVADPTGEIEDRVAVDVQGADVDRGVTGDQESGVVGEGEGAELVTAAHGAHGAEGVVGGDFEGVAGGEDHLAGRTRAGATGDEAAVEGHGAVDVEGALETGAGVAEIVDDEVAAGVDGDGAIAVDIAHGLGAGVDVEVTSAGHVYVHGVGEDVIGAEGEVAGGDIGGAVGIGVGDREGAGTGFVEGAEGVDAGEGGVSDGLDGEGAAAAADTAADEEG